MKTHVKIINAFIDGAAGGNPAGVVLDADSLSADQKLQIAAQVGLSETAFISKSKIADFKLDFFTPNRQIAHCGHATIATFSYLQQLGKIPNPNTSKETMDGPRKIRMDGESAFMEQTSPRYIDASKHLDEILHSLQVSKDDLLNDFQPVVVNTGNSFMIIPLKDKATVKRIQPDSEIIYTISEIYDLIGFYIFTPDTDIPDRDAGARMFGPRYSIPEEAATGMAAGPLACYLYDIMDVKKETFLIEQGHWMPQPSPSIITVRLELDSSGKIERLFAGGKARMSREMIIDL